MLRDIAAGLVQRFSPFRNDVPAPDQVLQSPAVDMGNAPTGPANAQNDPKGRVARASEEHVQSRLIAQLQATAVESSPARTSEWQQVGTCKQWTIEMEGPAGGEVKGYRISNLSPEGKRQFYQLESGAYGQPIIKSEPDRAVTPPSACAYVNANGDAVDAKEKISGFICKDASGKTIERFSLTNAANKKIDWNLSDDGVLTIGEKTFHLYALVNKDKNRMINYDGFFREGKPDTKTVKILELEDLV